MLKENERKKFTTIEKLEKGEITRKEAANELSISLRQIDRLRIKFRSYGEQGFEHKNRGRSNPNKIDDSIIEELENLYLSECYYFNFVHFYEKLVLGNYKISCDVMSKRFIKDDIISPLAHKKTLKIYNEKMKTFMENDYSDEQEQNQHIELFKSRMIEAEKAHPRRANNLYVFGQEIQMDACNKIWFGEVPSFLHLAVDKATKKVLAGWFEYEEITRGYFVLLFNRPVRQAF